MFSRISNLIKGFFSIFIGGLEKKNPEALLEVEKNQREAAAKTALDFKKVQAEHDEIKTQLEDAEVRYKELVNARDVSIDAARSKIEELRRGIDDMKVQTAMAELNEMASGMIGTIGGSGDNLNRLGEIVEEERTKAAGRARVAKDSLDLTDVKMQEAEQDALAEMALADFAAQAGITLEDETPASPQSESTTQSSMGPVSEQS